MDKTNNNQPDKWDLALDEQIKVLKECQKSHNLNSCTPCEKLLACPVRKEYIKAVYESMNKGSGGGFEF
jgi:hypothetical protein